MDAKNKKIDFPRPAGFFHGAIIPHRPFPAKQILAILYKNYGNFLIFPFSVL